MPFTVTGKFREPPANGIRMYQGLWELIARNKSNTPIKVDCPLGNQVRLIRAVRKEKAISNVLRKNVGAVTFGRLMVTQDANNPRTLLFQLEWNGDMI